MTLEQLNIISTYCERQCDICIKSMKESGQLVSMFPKEKEWVDDYNLVQEKYNNYYSILQIVNSQIDDFIKMTVIL